MDSSPVPSGPDVLVGSLDSDDVVGIPDSAELVGVLDSCDLVASWSLGFLVSCRHCETTFARTIRCRMLVLCGVGCVVLMSTTCRG